MSSSIKGKPPKDKVGIKTISTKEIAVAKRLTPFEDLTHIAGIASISIGGRKDIGAIILKKNDGLQIKFCFDCQGIHPSVSEEQIVPIFEGIEAGLKEIPYGETLTLHLGSLEAAFALTEKEDFRASFLKKLAEVTPPGAFNGSIQTSLVPHYVSEPRKIGSGKWQVDVVATLVTFSKEDNAGSGIAFNKTVTVQAISTPQSPPDTTEIAKKIYQARRSGLEITEIVDLDLQKNQQ
ncbi:hypothetical protein [Mastigocladopsis repens]|uniref:hypothetical protein n=1 Tax=Mastigocladopsis repens TaxID=221287 RepID=UPI0002DBFA5C